MRVLIEKIVWHLDVGSSHPGGAQASKGLAVRQLKRYVSWVKNVVRQFGPYLLYFETKNAKTLVREDQVLLTNGVSIVIIT